MIGGFSAAACIAVSESFLKISTGGKLNVNKGSLTFCASDEIPYHKIDIDYLLWNSVQ